MRLCPVLGITRASCEARGRRGCGILYSERILSLGGGNGSRMKLIAFLTLVLALELQFCVGEIVMDVIDLKHPHYHNNLHGPRSNTFTACSYRSPNCGEGEACKKNENGRGSNSIQPEKWEGECVPSAGQDGKFGNWFCDYDSNRCSEGESCYITPSGEQSAQEAEDMKKRYYGVCIPCIQRSCRKSRHCCIGHGCFLFSCITWTGTT